MDGWNSPHGCSVSVIYLWQLIKFVSSWIYYLFEQPVNWTKFTCSCTGNSSEVLELHVGLIALSPLQLFTLAFNHTWSPIVVIFFGLLDVKYIFILFWFTWCSSNVLMVYLELPNWPDSWKTKLTFKVYLLGFFKIISIVNIINKAVLYNWILVWSAIYLGFIA